MPIFYFFDLPVYRLSREKYYNAQKEYVNSRVSNKFYEENPIKKTIARHFHWEQFGGMWEYNEIIGYIRLHILGSQVRGEYYVNNAKRQVASRCKKRRRYFVYLTHKISVEETLPLSNDNEAIYQAILGYIENCRKEKELVKRHIDTSLFEAIGPFIDWQTLIKNNDK